MKCISIVYILAGILLTTVMGCSLTSNSNIAVYDKEDIYIDWTYNDALAVLLTPTDNAQAGVVYVVDLYEKDAYRNSITVEWNQPELNIKQPLLIYFPLSHEEWAVYIQCHEANECYLSDTFSVSVHK